MKQVNFIEDPTHRTLVDKPVYANIPGHRWDSVFIEVCTETYLSEHFTKWLRECVMTRLNQGGNIRIAIVLPDYGN